MKKLFLLDAYALIFRSYYAFIKNPRISSKGVNTSAVLGFVNTLEEVLNKEKPTHIAVAFDPGKPTFRHKAYPAYKAQREKTPEDIKISVPVIKEILEAFRFPILEMDGYEADDVIGTASVRLNDGETEIFMMTSDKDYAQLVRPHVSIYRPSLRKQEAEVLGVEEVKAKYDINDPLQMIDLLALMGDASDNIPGCTGVGQKTATMLIKEYGSVENLLEHREELKMGLRIRVENCRKQIMMSKWLATIKTDVPLDLDEEKLKICEPDTERLRKIYEELEFKNQLKRLAQAEPPVMPPDKQYAGDLFSAAGMPISLAVGPENVPTRLTLADVPHKYHLVNTPEGRKELLSTLLHSHAVCLDTETTSKEAIRAKLVGLSFSVSKGEAWYVPARDVRVAEEFRPLYENPSILKVGQNLKYDLLVLENCGIHLCGPMFDTMIAHYLVSPELRHSMDDMAENYLNYKTIHIKELIGARGKKQRSMADLLPERVYEYACEDADITLQLKYLLEKEMKEKGVDGLFWQVEMPLMPVLAQMERNGVRIDTEGLKESSLMFTRRMQQIEQEIHRQAGMPFNINSPKQVGELLFDRLKIVENARRTKRGQYETGEEILEALRHRHPIVEMILEFRGLKKLLGTYVDALPELINPATGHIHTSFNQTVAQTGRLSSSNPNLQNIPVRNDEGKEVRKAFIPEPGELFFSADYSQIELRLMAHLSGDRNLIEDFCAGHDIHAATASKIFHKPLADVTKEERRSAKTANFGIIYGISAFGLAERLGCGRKEAKLLIEDYFETYPGVRKYMDDSIERTRRTGFTETLFHRRLAQPNINSRNATVRGMAERNAINAPIQGTAADIIKIAMINISQRMRKEGLRSKMILQVHDELNFSVPPEEKEAMERLVIEEMQGVCKLSVPLVADCGWGDNWLEAH
ncbi:MAG: DNA polymerase I [Prevotellaceae bacterium]|nr:DNA polymerase I [Prevotellaceae bacterium]